MQQFIGCDAHKKFSVFVAVNEKGHAGEALRVAHDRQVYREFLARLPARSHLRSSAVIWPGCGFWPGCGSVRDPCGYFAAEGADQPCLATTRIMIPSQHGTQPPAECLPTGGATLGSTT